MADKVLLHTKVNQAAWLTLNRPECMNALNLELSSSLLAKLLEIELDDSIRVLVITGSAPAFCAGADLNEVMADPAPGEDALIDVIVSALGRVRHFKKPVIAAVNGITLAGGLELLMCCDLVYASDEAMIGDGHANYGLFPAAGGAVILPRLIPMCEAKKLLFTGEYIDVKHFKKWGLVNDTFPPNFLYKEVQNIADRLSKTSPLVISRMKRVINDTDGETREAALHHEFLEFESHYRSYDMSEGVKAFKGKRKPKFKGA